MSSPSGGGTHWDFSFQTFNTWFYYATASILLPDIWLPVTPKCQNFRFWSSDLENITVILPIIWLPVKQKCQNFHFWSSDLENITVILPIIWLPVKPKCQNFHFWSSGLENVIRHFCVVIRSWFNNWTKKSGNQVMNMIYQITGKIWMPLWRPRSFYLTSRVIPLWAKGVGR